MLVALTSVRKHHHHATGFDQAKDREPAGHSKLIERLPTVTEPTSRRNCSVTTAGPYLSVHRCVGNPRKTDLGECAGSPQFTHVSEDDSRIIIDNIAGEKRSTRDRVVPYCMFTDPPLAHIGLSEGEAERHGVAVRV